MARRRTKSLVRQMAPDSRFGSEVVTKFINTMMWDGKKSTATTIFNDAMDLIKEKTGAEGIETFDKALENVKPQIEVKSRRVGGVTYQVPIEVYPMRKQSLAIRWIIGAARSRNGKSMAQKLSSELLDAAENNGGAIKKKEEVKRMAEANRAFSHYAW
ncbi:MAG: 30S ribosomal protein S7 [Leptospiraceae bacterium]|nr:30S ribosomal protein S7 [Leptospiraceae bacterium]MCB1199687.1 30S ribosomal protein S7 [Leptospiraceae bacterium]